MFRARITPRCLNVQLVNATANSSFPDLSNLKKKYGKCREISTEQNVLLFSEIRFDWRLKEIIAEEIQRSNKANASVVSSLKHRH